MKENAITIQHSIRKVRTLVCKAFKKAGIPTTSYRYNPADLAESSTASYTIEWTAEQERKFNAALDEMEAIHPELSAVEIY